ncbi:MAG: pseudouridine synthase [Betaproteobacteria bacterium]
MNDLPDENPNRAGSESGDGSQATAAEPGPSDAQPGEGGSGGNKNRRRRRSRHKRGAGSEALELGAGGSADGGGQVAPRATPSQHAAPPLDPVVREGATALFSEVVSGAYDALEPLLDAEPQRSPDGPGQADETQAQEATAAPSRPGPAHALEPSIDEPEGDVRAGTGAEVGEEGDDADDAELAHRRVLAPDPDAPKLHKVLAQSGLGSRRDLEAMIETGRVTVNGEVAHTGQRISHGDRVQIDGKPVRIRLRQGRPRVLAYHKPVGEVVTHDDPQQRPTVFRRLPRLVQGKWQSVGRLDLNTEGLLLFTNSGELANQLMHPRFGVEREYAVRVLGRLADEARERLLQGVEIEGHTAAFLSIEDGGGEGVNHWYRVVLNEGRNREVRRLFDAVGLTVSRLIRIRYGCVVLPRGLKRGAWVDLDERDVMQLQQLTGTRNRQPEGGRGAARGRKGRDGAQPPTGRDRGPERRAEAAPKRERREWGEDGPIPNPLQQTFDKRAFKEQQSRPKREYGDDGPIPNPLQQTFDQRALKEAQRKPKREYGEDGPIPNPLQQTYDKRALQEARRGAGNRDYGDDVAEDFADDDGPIPSPLQQTFDKRFVGKGGGAGGAGAGGRAGRGRSGGTGRGHASGPDGSGPAKPGGRGKGPAAGGPGAGRGGRSGGKADGKGGSKGGSGKAPAQPDPMRTAVGYIGADANLGRGKSGRGRRGR